MSFSLNLMDPFHWMLDESLSVWPAMLYVDANVLEIYSNNIIIILIYIRCDMVYCIIVMSSKKKRIRMFHLLVSIQTLVTLTLLII